MRVTTMLSAVALAVVLGAASGAVAQTTSGPNAKFEACRNQAVAAGLAGEARKQAVDTCLAQPGVQAAGPNDPSYAACRAGAITRGLAGDALGRFINQCMNG